ncbi:MAG: tyrosine--tRNA ligase, partial [Acidimicrobiia bacterium]|nr:tyrosine--tRNA ligase [Acidimicrobiia bacterium]
MLAAEEQLEILMRGVERVVPEPELAALLAKGKPLRVKLGLDPTAHEVHLGWAVVIGLLRRFQELGHTAVLIVGDFTAQVGDPSGKSETRQRLDDAAVKEYASSVLGEVKNLLSPDNLEIRYNSEWLSKLNMPEVLDLASKVTLAQMMERADFAKRYGDNDPISLIEFMYPLLQGMDSVAVESDIELGGADQLWNLLMGRELQAKHGQPGQVAMTTGLLVGTDGTRKMSQSYDNFISVKDSADEMFGKVMSLPDD